MKTCNQCGKEVDSKQDFCDRCGSGDLKISIKNTIVKKIIPETIIDEDVYEDEIQEEQESKKRLFRGKKNNKLNKEKKTKSKKEKTNENTVVQDDTSEVTVNEWIRAIVCMIVPGLNIIYTFKCLHKNKEVTSSTFKNFIRASVLVWIFTLLASAFIKVVFGGIYESWRMGM